MPFGLLGPPLYTYRQPPAWRHLAQLPQGRKAARVSELCRVRGGPSIPSRVSSRVRCCSVSRSARLRRSVEMVAAVLSKLVPFTITRDSVPYRE